MIIEEKRKKLLELLEIKEKELNEYYQKYEGPGLLKKIKRFLRYQNKYLRYSFTRISPCFFTTKTFWGENFLTFLPQELQFYFFGLPNIDQEIRLTKFLIKNLKKNCIFYDIGAYCGFYSLLVKKIGYKEIHAFEPVPNAFKCLQKNLSDHKNVFLNPLALFNKTEEIDFYDGTDTGDAQSSTFDISQRTDKLAADFKKIKVHTVTLDDYCLNHSKPTFLKIDVEGAESYVIEGGIKLLKEITPIIAMEVWRKPLKNESHLEAIEILYKLGYKSYKINQEGELEFREKLSPEKEIPEGKRLDNFIFQT
jgi:FkbM family methyltransferase